MVTCMTFGFRSKILFKCYARIVIYDKPLEFLLGTHSKSSLDDKVLILKLFLHGEEDHPKEKYKS